MTKELIDGLREALPLLDGLTTGRDCEEYAFATGNGFQAMTYCPSAFEALRHIPAAIDRLQSLSDTVERLVEALRPFARAADEWDGEPAALCVEFCAYDGPRMNPSTNVAAFRHANAIVAAHQEHSHEQ